MAHEFILGKQVLLRSYAFVHVPAELLCARIAADHGKWLSPLADAAVGDGEALRVRVGPIDALPLLSKTVTLYAGEAIERNEVTVVPIKWQATSSPGLFPGLEADLQVAAIGPMFTQLTLRGHYDPPLGTLGRQIDRLLLHRVAEATVRSFMRRLAESLTKTVSEDRD